MQGNQVHQNNSQSEVGNDILKAKNENCNWIEPELKKYRKLIYFNFSVIVNSTLIITTS